MARIVIILLIVAGGLTSACGTSKQAGPAAGTRVSGPTAVTTITEAGGAIALPDGVRLSIPAGALQQPLAVSLSEQGTVPAIPGTLAGMGHPLHIELHGQTLAQAATLEIPFDASKIPPGGSEDEVFASYYDEASGKWVAVGGEADQQRHVLVLQITHASWWNPFTWNWEPWIAGLSKVLDLKLTSLFDLLKPSSPCELKTAHVAIDDSKANHLVRACVTKDDANAPSIELSNLATFFLGISASGSGAAGMVKRTLGPGESIEFPLDTSGLPPLTVSADFTQEAMNWFVVDLVISALPFGDLVPAAGVGEIVRGLSDTSDLTAAIEDLLRGDGLGAAEEIEHFLHDEQVIHQLVATIIAYGKAHGVTTMQKLSVDSLKKLLVAVTALNVIVRSMDFIGNYFYHNHSQVGFAWPPPPCPIHDAGFCQFVSAARAAFAGNMDAGWFTANVQGRPCSNLSGCTGTCADVGNLGSEGACVPSSVALDETRKLGGGNLVLFGVVYPQTEELGPNGTPAGPALLFAGGGTSGIMALTTKDGSGAWKINFLVYMRPGVLYGYVKPQQITLFPMTTAIDPTWLFTMRSTSRIAYAGSDGNIWTVDPSGANGARITSDGGNGSPRWSSDHKRIAFVHTSGPATGPTNREVDVMNPDGSGRRTVAAAFPGFGLGIHGQSTLPAVVTNVRWSHDQCTIYVGVAPGPVGMHPIHSIPLCGGQPHDDNFAHYFDVSSQGTFAMATTYNKSFTIGPLAGPETSTIPLESPGPIAWSPDSTQLAVRGRAAVVIVHSDGTSSRSMSVMPAGSQFPGSIAWDDSGDAVVFDSAAGIEVMSSTTGIMYGLAQGTDPSW